MAGSHSEMGGRGRFGVALYVHLCFKGLKNDTGGESSMSSACSHPLCWDTTISTELVEAVQCSPGRTSSEEAIAERIRPEGVMGRIRGALLGSPRSGGHCWDCHGQGGTVGITMVRGALLGLPWSGELCWDHHGLSVHICMPNHPHLHCLLLFHQSPHPDREV